MKHLIYSLLTFVLFFNKLSFGDEIRACSELYCMEEPDVGCSAGTYLNSLTGECITWSNCPVGTYVYQTPSVLNDRVCAECPQGYTTTLINQDGISSCNDKICSYGEYYIPSLVEIIEEEDDEMTTLPTDDNLHCIGEFCLDKRELGDFPTDHCSCCQTGKYQDLTYHKLLTCIDCPFGLTTLNICSDNINDCIDLNDISDDDDDDDDDDDPSLCESGYQYDGLKCECCPMNTWKVGINGDNCLACIDSFETVHTCATSCRCPPRYYLNPEVNRCLKCPANTYKDNYETVGSSDCIPCDINHYSYEGAYKCIPNIYQCPSLYPELSSDHTKCCRCNEDRFRFYYDLNGITEVCFDNILLEEQIPDCIPVTLDDDGDGDDGCPNETPLFVLPDKCCGCFDPNYEININEGTSSVFCYNELTMSLSFDQVNCVLFISPSSIATPSPTPTHTPITLPSTPCSTTSYPYFDEPERCCRCVEDGYNIRKDFGTGGLFCLDDTDTLLSIYGHECIEIITTSASSTPIVTTSVSAMPTSDVTVTPTRTSLPSLTNTPTPRVTMSVSAMPTSDVTVTPTRTPLPSCNKHTNSNNDTICNKHTNSNNDTNTNNDSNTITISKTFTLSRTFL
jgi:hypothetical protein